ncbi:hypothetical protein ACIXMR_21610 [Bacteroides fragilis]
MERSTQFMMTGYAYDDKNSTSNLVNIPGTESGPASLECTLRPERTDARVEFVVKTEKPSDKNWTALDFRPRGWRVVNVPASRCCCPTGQAMPMVTVAPTSQPRRCLSRLPSGMTITSTLPVASCSTCRKPQDSQTGHLRRRA